MRNLKVIISYNGAAYHGWQRQHNRITVQETIEEKMGIILNCPVTVNGCSRTDAGVHAKEFCYNAKIDNSISCDGLKKAMNSLLPKDIAVLSCCDADESFHARYDSKGKEYMYLVNNGRDRDVFMADTSFFYPFRLDEERLDNASKLFIGEHDFAAFCKAEAKEHLKSTVRTITDFRVIREGDYVKFFVRGNGFLHNMVRILVGTLIYVNEGKRTEKDIILSLEKGEREIAGKTISPSGLYLNKVFY